MQYDKFKEAIDKGDIGEGDTIFTIEQRRCCRSVVWHTNIACVQSFSRRILALPPHSWERRKKPLPKEQ